MGSVRGSWDKEVPSEASAYNWRDAPRYQGADSPAVRSVPQVVDLFSGCGGISAGFHSAGMQTALAVDIHEPSIATFRLNHSDSATVLGDINQVADRQLADFLDSRRIDVVVGGAPCQGFSLCNRKQFDDDPRNLLFLQYMRVVKLLKPSFVLFENVQNIRSVADGHYTRLIEEYFNDLGYSLTSGVIDALDFGVPQRRKRLIFLGMLGTGKLVPWPIGDSRGAQPLTVLDAIGDLPQLGNDDEVRTYAQAPRRPFQHAMRGDAVRLLNHRSPRHPQETIDRISSTKAGQPMYDSFCQRIRLSWDHPSPTQVCGGIRPQFQFGHPDQPRGLSIRERCRIQSFPDTYEITGGIVMGRVQTGNAVPPLVAEAFGRLIMSIITGEPRIESTLKADQIRLPLVPYA
jgi:DNA (cytosine-5)-methyltransferase 1